MTKTRIHNNKIEFFTTDKEQARKITEELSAFTPGYENNTSYRMGKWDGLERFYKLSRVSDGWFFKIPTGFIKRLRQICNLEDPKIDYSDAAKFYQNMKNELPFTPYKHQLKMFLGMSSNKNQLGIAATGSGKSLVAYLLTRYFRNKGMKILIVVPTIDLTNQLLGDFKDYLATDDFINHIQLMGGEYNSKEVKEPVLISTYQSCAKADLSSFDVVITDECHLAKSETLLSILKNPFKIKLGMTGSLPPMKIDMLKLEQNFGLPVMYINARKLIDLGLATDVTIVPIFLHQKQKLMKYHDEVKFIKESIQRKKWVSNFLKKLNGLSVALYQHTEHGENQWEDLTQVSIKKYKNNFAKQKQLGVFFMSGTTNTKTRKMILEYLADIDDENIIVIAQLKLLSTGINLKALKNLIFLSSTKSYVTTIQSIGRVMRLHESKSNSIVFDLIDDFTNHGKRKTENYSLKHFWERLSFYESQELNIIEKEINLI